ncbi:peptidase S1 and S6 chymotrypsin/Hap [Catenulispora acidiphila DSM 44928]|uniref:Peptidase S1 and S6 chymotrypsin/Hap n=1 Tax=Catenulispora acidiphila (strain DSM 44928 / JCM 14897 / NBRC 102108 / NRRL B-24433 / ID139908) TaxID=479433 RepID=C7QKS1_CATAD|nr:S1C family serine protease [Catenulispora acidiphila]ACU77170.1 peptidase S1 and S6 chymotrypsin/Hap [Catenulispora acidiphila DSM 44928]
MSAISAMAAFSGGLADLIEQVMPNVVAIRGEQGPDSWTAGSGFVLDDACHVVTNNHVVDQPEGFTWTAAIHGFPTQPIRILGRDPLTDLAVVELSEPHASALALRDRPVRLGEFVLAMGNPLGDYPESVSVGIVSGLSRQLQAAQHERPLQRLIQTDAAVNPGNSGGPLVDLDGAVIGVNTMIRDDAQGMAFAVPAATVARVIPQLIAEGRVTRASLGIAVHIRDAEVDGRTTKREIVTRARDTDSPFHPGDVLISLAGQDIDGHAGLFDLLDAALIGKETPVEVVREGKRVAFDVVPRRLAERK